MKGERAKEVSSIYKKWTQNGKRRRKIRFSLVWCELGTLIMLAALSVLAQKLKEASSFR